MLRLTTLPAMFVTLLFAATVSAAPAPIIPAPPQLSATGYLLIDARTGKILVEQNIDQRLPPASLTKIMTSYLVADAIQRGTVNMDDSVRISQNAYQYRAVGPEGREGSMMFVEANASVLVEDLVRGMIIQSGNDASYALAEHVAGSEAAFVDVMNQQAARLGMTGTNYVNVTGWPAEEHYTTAKDLATLAISMIDRFPAHYAFYSEKYYTYNDIRQPNRNRLLWRDPSVDGMKTGHTAAAGYCLVSSAKRDGMRLVAVVMGTASEEARAVESQKLLTYGFRYFETVDLYAAGESLNRARVWGGTHSSINLGLAEEVVVTLPRGARENLTAAMDLPAEIHGPLADGEAIGTLKVMMGDEELLNRPLVTLNAVEASGFFASLWDAISLFFLKLFGGDPLAVPA